MTNLFRQLFGPKVLETTRSKVNSEITVLQDHHQIRLLVGGLTQSGQYVEQIWTKAVKHLQKDQQFQPESCMILGLGGGTAAKLVASAWPGITICGVELDPQMIRLGKKYLELGQIPNLKIIIGDAVGFIKKSRQNYDLTIVDTYLGDQIPSAFSSVEFLNLLKTKTSAGGYAVFNLLFYTDDIRVQARKIIEHLKTRDVQLLHELTNLLVVVKS